MHMKARSSSDLWHSTGCSLPWVIDVHVFKNSSAYTNRRVKLTSSRNIWNGIRGFVSNAFGERNQLVGGWRVEWLRKNLIISLECHSEVLHVLMPHRYFRQLIITQFSELHQPLTHLDAVFEMEKLITEKDYRMKLSFYRAVNAASCQQSSTRDQHLWSRLDTTSCEPPSRTIWPTFHWKFWSWMWNRQKKIRQCWLQLNHFL